jgi:hypothetical protein
MIYVFKTSVKTEEDILKLKSKLDNLFEIIKWNFDLEDCDNILRVDISGTSSKKIIKLLSEANFECQELE